MLSEDLYGVGVGLELALGRYVGKVMVGVSGLCWNMFATGFQKWH
jgi:hypothetical protein